MLLVTLPVVKSRPTVCEGAVVPIHERRVIVARLQVAIIVVTELVEQMSAGADVPIQSSLIFVIAKGGTIDSAQVGKWSREGDCIAEILLCAFNIPKKE